MGASVSAPILERHRTLLGKLCGLQGVDKDDALYQHLLSGSAPAAIEPFAVQEFLEPYCEQIMVHNPMSHNFQTLLLYTIQLMEDAQSSTSTAPEIRTSTPNSSNASTANAKALSAMHALSFSMRFVGTLIQHVHDTGCSSSTLTALFQMNTTQEQQLQQLQAQQSLRNMQQQRQQQQHHQWSEGQHKSPPLLTAFLGGAMRILQHTAKSCVTSGPSHLLLFETLRMLLIGCSSQMYSQHVRCTPGTHTVMEALMGDTAGDAALQVVQALLHLFITRPLPPAQAPIYSPSEAALSGAYKALRYTTATLLWLPTKAASLLSSPTTPSGTSYSPVADSALLLLLVLTHCPEEPPTQMNPFRGALRALSDPGYEQQDAEGGLSSTSSSSLSHQATSSASRIHFRTLYEALGRGLVDEGGTLLLYSLLHECNAFQDYILSSTDPEVLLLPILHLLHRCLPTHTSHLYMLQILLLILSQDAAFCRNIHRIVLLPAQLSAVAEWLREPSLRTPVTLGSIMAVVLLRTVTAYFGGGGAPGEPKRDLGLPTNALAALANMAPHMEKLHSHAAYRLVSLLQSLGRRHSRLSNAAAVITVHVPLPQTSRSTSINSNTSTPTSAAAATAAAATAAAAAAAPHHLHPASPTPGELHQSVSIGVNLSSVAGVPAAAASSNSNSVSTAAALLAGQQAQQHAQQEAAAELPVVEDFLRIVLELINAILTTSLQNNQELLYALLQRQELLTPYRQHPRLGELIENLQMLLQFFNRRLDEAKAPSGVEGSKGKGPDAWDVARVQAVLAVATPFWRPDRLRSFPEMRFVYEQDGSSEEFFVPTIWALIVRNTAATLPWSVSNIALFEPKP